MLADNLDRIVAKLSKELVRALREASRKEVLALLPGLARELAAQAPAAKAKPGPKAKPAAKAKPGRKKPGPKAKPGPKKAPAAPRKRGAGSLTRKILKLLEVRREGFRFEEIQRRFKADPIELRETLATLISGGRVARHGQARGTRYSLPLGDGESPEPGDGEFHLAEESPEATPAPPASIEVTDAMIDEVRGILVETSAPTSIPELLAKCAYTRDQLKAILEQMRSSGLVERASKGPNPRFQLSSAPKKSAEGPRVKKRHPDEHRPDEEPAAPEAAPAADPVPPEGVPEV